MIFKDYAKIKSQVLCTAKERFGRQRIVMFEKIQMVLFRSVNPVLLVGSRPADGNGRL